MFAIDHQTMLQCPPRPSPIDRKWNTRVEPAPSCPRCASSNTKFCYYNNYSLSQPRYFCKGCRRYWTKGGSLRNVPVGGGCRRSRRASKSSRGGVPVNHARNFSGFSSSSFGSSDLDSTVHESDNNHNDSSSEIDLAVVFANFLNQEPSDSQPEFISQESVSITDSLSPDLDSDSTLLSQVQIQESSDLLEDYIFVAGDQENQDQDQERIQEIVMENQEMSEFGLQALIGDEIVQDALWCEAESSFSNVTWQMPAGDQLRQPEIYAFPGDDQLKSSNDLFSGNGWSSFDLSEGFDVFSRP